MVSQWGYDYFDLLGFTYGTLFFFVVILYSFYLLKKFDLNRSSILGICIFSAAGHFLGALCNYWYSITIGSDSVFYFHMANIYEFGVNYYFAFLILGYLKTYLIGNSFLAAFLLFGAIGFVGSIYYLLTYKILLDRISGSNKLYFIDRHQLYFPALLLLCWPSYFFWTAGLVKDSFSYLAIAMFLFVLARGKLFSNLITFTIASLLAIFVRPYLFIIVVAASCIFLALGSKWNFFIKIFCFIFIALITMIMIPYISKYYWFLGSFAEISQYAFHQQNLMNIGSCFPVPTNDYHLVFVFLPYLFLANLFLPMGIFANNLLGYLSSLENAYLLWWIIFFLRNKVIWQELKNKIQITKFFMLYFLIGMSCFCMMSTNVGLAMREKIMYVPALLICIFLTYAYKRILIIENRLV